MTDQDREQPDLEAHGGPWVAGGPTPGPVVLAEPDPRWATSGAGLAAIVHEALGEAVLDLQHVGSTSVPGLLAKPVIDLVLTVAHPADEQAWLPVLVDSGWVLTVREPDWFEHRCLRFAAPAANLHVFGPGCSETAVMLAFRDWLRSSEGDRELYASAKRTAADATNAVGGHVMDYNARKEPVLLQIRERALVAAGLTS